MTSDHARRSRRSAITMTTLVVFFVAGTVIGFRLLFAEAPTLATAADDSDAVQCEITTIPAGGELATGQVTVTVYNAGSVSGLANRTLINLQERGFRPGTVGNVPEGVEAGRNVTIITADQDSGPVQLVAAQFRGNVRYAAPTQPQGDEVEVVVGPRYRDLRRNFPESVEVAAPTQVCVPVEATPEPPA